MVSNKCFRSVLLLLLASVAWEQLVAGSKIAYKKPLYGKMSHFKDRRVKQRPSTATPAPTTTTTEEEWPVEFIINTTPRAVVVRKAEETVQLQEPSEEPELEQKQEQVAPPPAADEEISSSSSTIPPSTVAESAEEEQEVEADTNSTSTTPTSLDNTIAPPPTPAVIDPNQPVPCTCGVFLSSQIKNGLPETPLIHNEMDRMYPCNAIGRKQCQTKCLEAIVQHLPNSASIVCGTLGQDCHKERAYLFIKNCQNMWVNTNLQAGREYCCKEGQPYRCPLLG